MKSVLITGASGGIGKAIAEEFASAGYFVGVNYNTNKIDAEKLAEKLGGIAVGFDVSDINAVVWGVKHFLTVAERIDVLVNCAGIALPVKTVLDTMEEEFDHIFSVNVKGVYNTIKTVIPEMLDNGGKIINISSMWGLVGGSCEAIYSASKAAVIGLTKALAKEYANAKITVNAIAPGFIDTHMNDNLSEENKRIAIEDIPLGRVGTGRDVARAALYLAENDFVTGEILNISGGEVI